MSLFGESLAMAYGGTTTLTDPDGWLVDWAGGRTTSGETVTPETAMGLSAYFACIRNSAQDVAKLPRQLRRRRSTRGSDQVVASEHQVARLLKKPNPVMRWQVWCQCMQGRALAQGNGYAEIVRNPKGEVLELWPVHPSRMKPRLLEDARTLVYDYYPMGYGGARATTLQARDVFHIRGFGDGIEGYSLARCASETLGLGLAAQKHAGAMYGEGLAKRIIGVIKGVVKPEAKKALREQLQQDRTFDPVGSRRIPLLPGDIDLQDFGITPEEAQFLEGREFTIEEIARWARMTLSKIQYHKRAQGWSTLEALNTDYAGDHLSPWLEVWKDELVEKTLTPEEQDAEALYFEFRLQGLLRGDTTARVTYYNAGLVGGWLSPNDVRELEDMNPIEQDGADAYRMQAQMVPLSDGEDDTEEDQEDDQPVLPPMPPPPDKDLEDAEDPEDEDEDEDAEEDDQADAVALFRFEAEALRPVATDAALRVIRRETKRATSAVTRNAGNAPRFTAWAERFAAEQAAEIAEAFGPLGAALESIAERYGCSGVASPGAMVETFRTFREPTAVSWRNVLTQPESDRADALAIHAFYRLTQEVTCD